MPGKKKRKDNKPRKDLPSTNPTGKAQAPVLNLSALKSHRTTTSSPTTTNNTEGMTSSKLTNKTSVNTARKKNPSENGSSVMTKAFANLEIQHKKRTSSPRAQTQQRNKTKTPSSVTSTTSIRAFASHNKPNNRKIKITVVKRTRRSRFIRIDNLDADLDEDKIVSYLTKICHCTGTILKRASESVPHTKKKIKAIHDKPSAGENFSS